MEQIYNPYLPLNVYIPDGEPHVFDDRLYIYGSHDQSGGSMYCPDHYEVWSAPVTNLRDWRREGISYLRTQDPSNADDARQLWAPDVTRGPDGRYYLYYCLSFYPEIGVAVSNSPAGPFTFYGHVHYPAHIRGGKLLQEGMVFDPAVLTDRDGRVYLYYGFAPACEREMHLPEFSREELEAMPPLEREKMRSIQTIVFGENSMVVELEPDMLTTKEEPRILIPGGHHTEGTGFEGHGFFEASSIRRIGDTYYFIYSSHKSHELCYAVSDRPDRGFRFGGAIISNGDIGLSGRETPVYPMGNNHGSIEQVGDACYIFYQRPTDGTEFSRQGHAERITIAQDGSIAQVEMTSCGLNGRPLSASGSYPAAIACHLTDPTVVNRIDYSDPIMKRQVCVTQKQNHSFITKIKDQTVIGYKYFDFPKEVTGKCQQTVLMELQGSFAGTICVSQEESGENPIGMLFCGDEAETAAAYGKLQKIDAAMPVTIRGACEFQQWTMLSIPICPQPGSRALYFHFHGEGSLDFKSFSFLMESKVK